MAWSLRIVKENIQTALIFEDDADWDIMFKEQLYEFAKGAQAIQGVDKSPYNSPYSPYGDDWDVLWIGHCDAANDKDDGNYWVVPDDPTVPPLNRIAGGAPTRSPRALGGNRTRITYEAMGGRCLAGYALSLRGARTLLYVEATTSAHPIDRAVSRLCGDRELLFRCIQPYPALVGVFKDSGDISKDSDRISVNGPNREVPQTLGIAYPVRLNLDRLIKGNLKFKPQWPEGGEWPEIGRDLVIPEGHLEFVKKEEFVDPNTLKQSRD